MPSHLHQTQNPAGHNVKLSRTPTYTAPTTSSNRFKRFLCEELLCTSSPPRRDCRLLTLQANRTPGANYTKYRRTSKLTKPPAWLAKMLQSADSCIHICCLAPLNCRLGCKLVGFKLLGFKLLPPNQTAIATKPSRQWQAPRRQKGLTFTWRCQQLLRQPSLLACRSHSGLDCSAAHCTADSTPRSYERTLGPAHDIQCYLSTIEL